MRTRPLRQPTGADVPASERAGGKTGAGGVDFWTWPPVPDGRCKSLSIAVAAGDGPALAPVAAAPIHNGAMADPRSDYVVIGCTCVDATDALECAILKHRIREVPAVAKRFARDQSYV